jgi:hypothetical protein
MSLHKETITKGTVVVWDGETTSLRFGEKDELGSKRLTSARTKKDMMT